MDGLLYAVPPANGRVSPHRGIPHLVPAAKWGGGGGVRGGNSSTPISLRPSSHPPMASREQGWFKFESILCAWTGVPSNQPDEVLTAGADGGPFS